MQDDGVAAKYAELMVRARPVSGSVGCGHCASGMAKRAPSSVAALPGCPPVMEKSPDKSLVSPTAKAVAPLVA
jgi:hypothetical protein